MNSWVLDNLEKMRAFEAVVRNGSLVKAANELGVSQPALSRLVSNLEEVSGKKLLDRSRMGCKATPEGRKIVAFFDRLLPMANDLEQKINSHGGVAGVLSLGTFESFAIAWWPEFLNGFYKEFPNLKITIRTADHGHHREKLQQGVLDLVVEACPDQHERITSLKVGTDSFGFYAPKIVTNEESLPLVYVPQAKDDRGKLLVELLRERGFIAKEVYELDSFTAVYEFIAAGLGVGVLPLRLAKRAIKKDLIKGSRKVLGNFGTHSICVSFLNENRNDPRIVTVYRALKKYLA
ncbi:MAG: LysR family transcriptional regulator [Bdellovibrio sp.]